MPSLNSQTAYCCALETLRDGSSNTARHATHDTNARRPTVTHETPTPMHGSNRPKQAHSHPQRRWRFQLRLSLREQRRRQCHERPKNATNDTNARRPTVTLETPDTNARRPTVTHETHDTNARLQPPKTGPFTPAKAMAVSVEAQPARAKATPVS